MGIITDRRELYLKIHGDQKVFEEVNNLVDILPLVSLLRLIPIGILGPTQVYTKSFFLGREIEHGVGDAGERVLNNGT